MPLEETDLTGGPRPVRRSFGSRASLSHTRRRDRVGRRKIDNAGDSRKNSVNSFYQNYPTYPYLNRSVRVMGEAGSSPRKSGLVLESCESPVEYLAVNEEAELLTKLRQRNPCLSAPNR